jgi:hypothetical protein
MTVTAVAHTLVCGGVSVNNRFVVGIQFSRSPGAISP